MKLRLALVLAAGATGCLTSDEPEVAETAGATTVLLGNIYQNGTLVSFENITNPVGLDLSRLVGLAACDDKALYAIEQYGSVFTLHFSNDAGQTWGPVNRAVVTKEIACDHGLLVTLDANHNLKVARTRFDGNLNGWYSTPASTQVDRLGGGDGSFYGVKATASGGDLYIASSRAYGNAICHDEPDGTPGSCDLIWGSRWAQLGATQVTGTGIIAAGTDGLLVGNVQAWSRRAFTVEPDGRVYTNTRILEGVNGWTPMDTGSERYLTLTAAAPNLLFGIQRRNNVIQLNRIRVEETSCSDGVDNDANGFVDGEDPMCVKPLAQAFCAAHVDGDYCADRYQPATFLGQANQNAHLLTCGTRGSYRTSTVKPGVCQRYPYSGNHDYLLDEESLVVPTPSSFNYYCSVQWPDGTWNVAVGGAACEYLKSTKANGSVVRAGMYSMTALNYVHAHCLYDTSTKIGIGMAPITEAKAALPATATRCYFQISAAAYPLFDRMWDPAHEIPGRLTNPFTHGGADGSTPLNASLVPFGFNEVGAPEYPGRGWVDRFGHDFGANRETAYDTPLDESRPVLAPADGVVLDNGSVTRDIRYNGGEGTPNQQELYVKFSIGSNAEYRESFVVSYAHLRKRLVVDRQTVRKGQILGFVGATGATGGFGHLHVGVLRTTNVNLHSPLPESGYHVDFKPDVTDTTGNNTQSFNAVDPLGWANSAADPWGYLWWNSGRGAWSPNLFLAGKQFTYTTGWWTYPPAPKN